MVVRSWGRVVGSCVVIVVAAMVVVVVPVAEAASRGCRGRNGHDAFGGGFLA